MKLFRSLLLFALTSPLLAQNVRWDFPIYTVQASGGNLLPVYAIPGALVSFYNEPARPLARPRRRKHLRLGYQLGLRVPLNHFMSMPRMATQPLLVLCREGWPDLLPATLLILGSSIQGH